MSPAPPITPPEQAHGKGDHPQPHTAANPPPIPQGPPQAVLDGILGRWYVERVMLANGDLDGVKGMLRSALADPTFTALARQRLAQVRLVTQSDSTDPKSGAPISRDYISRVHQELLEAVLDG